MTDSLNAQTQFIFNFWPNMADADLPPVNVPSHFADETDPTVCYYGQTGCTGSVMRSHVSTMKRSNGQGGFNQFDYSLAGRLDGYYSTESRGFLGYQAVEKRNVQTGEHIYTFYGNLFPYIGEIVAEHKYDGDWNDTAPPNAISIVEKTYGLHDMPPVAGTSLPSSVFRYLDVETRLNYEIDGGSATQFGVSQMDMDYTFNDRILSTSTRTETAGATASPSGGNWIVAGVEKTLSTAITFESGDTIDWLVNFPTEEVVTHGNVPGEVGSKSVTTQYVRYANTMALASSTRFPGDAELENTVTIGYDLLGNVSSMTVAAADVPNRTTTLSSYVDDRYPTLITNAAGHETTFNSIDKRFGTPSSITDANGNVTLNNRDAFGRIVQAIGPDGRVVTGSYAECGTCPTVGLHTSAYQISISDNAGPDSRVYVDDLGRTVRKDVTSFDGLDYSKTETLYDTQGRIEKVSRPYVSGLPVYVAYQYDIEDRVIREDRPDGSYTAFDYSYDAASSSLKVLTTDRVITPSMADEDQQQARYFNSLGQIVESRDYKDPSSYVGTEFDYDWYGNLDFVRVDGNAATATTMVYDAAGNKRQIDEPNTGVTTFDFDGLGRVRTQTDANGIVTSFSYDDLDRVTQRIDDMGGAGEITNTFTFDDPAKPKGALSSRSNTDGFSESYTYDSLARVIGVTTAITHDSQNQTLSITQTYDSTGRPLSTTYPSGMVVKNQYNSAGYLSAVLDGVDNPLETIDSVNAAFQVKQVSFANSLSSTNTYDPNTGLLTGVQTGIGGAVQDLSYVWRSNGILRSRADSAKTEVFSYDRLNRLIQAATAATGRTLTYDYDNLGNLSYRQSNVAGDQDFAGYVYGGGNAGPHAVSSLSIAGVSQNLAYDAVGNVTSIDSASGTNDDRTLEYNSFNKPTKIILGSVSAPEVTEQLAYGPDAARYYHKSEYTEGATSITERTFYTAGGFYEKTIIDDGTNIDTFEKTSVTDVVQHRTVELQGSAKTSHYVYLHRDHLGSVDVITDATGNVVNDLAYDPFGARRQANWSGEITPAELAEIITNANLRTRRGFTGHEHFDRVGIIHMNGRIYEPRIGRFLSADPIVQDPGFSQSYNRYNYVFNSPLSFTDPTGFEGDYGGGGPWIDLDPGLLDKVRRRVHGSLPTDEQILAAMHGTVDAALEYQASQMRGDSEHNAAVAAAQIVGETVDGDVKPESEGAGDGAQQGVHPQVCAHLGCHGIDYSQHRLATDDELLPLYATAIVIDILIPLPPLLAATRGPTTVIGKIDDLKTLQVGERTLLDRLPNLGSPKANWKQNSGVLRQEMSRGLPIRDASVDPSTGALINNTGFLRAERNLLQNQGWRYDPLSTMWHPPGP